MKPNAFAERELGEKLPLSIGTALALETLLDTTLETPWLRTRVPFFYLNLHTLFRNLYGSMTVLSRVGVSDVDFAVVLAKEIQFIAEFLRSDGKGTELVVYCPTYNELTSKYKYANIKTNNTPKQKEYAHISTNTMQVLIKNQTHFGVKIELTDYRPPKNVERMSVVMTNHPVDLLFVPSSVVLLESHTGKYKPFSEWNSKLAGSTDTSHMPFNALTLQVFGDNTDFGPMARNVKEALVAVATERKWSTITTKDRIRVSLDLMKDRITAERLKLLLQS